MNRTEIHNAEATHTHHTRKKSGRQTYNTITTPEMSEKNTTTTNFIITINEMYTS